MVTQTTQNAAINWQAFSIGASETVHFVQPGVASITLNRVTGQDPTQILGGMTANGRIFVLNPNGVIFGQNAQVAVGGLVASTLGITDADFSAGRIVFSAGPHAGGVFNAGTIVAAPGGHVALIGPQVGNSGTIEASGGAVALAAGNTVTLIFAGSSLLGVRVDVGGLDLLVERHGAIRSAGGRVMLSADARDQLLRAAVNSTGIVEATSLTATDGVIRLGDASIVRAAEINLAGGPLSGLVSVAGSLDAAGGRVAITGHDVLITAGSLIDASGTAGGGSIAIGGGWQGLGTLAHATNVMVEAGATLKANAGQSGSGGTIAIWSTGATRVSGALQARGGAVSGNGGSIETSGHVLDVTNVTIDAAAPMGASGTWLLDPYDLTVTGTASTAPQSPTGVWTSGSGATNVLNTTINSALDAGTNVILQTGSGGNGLGDITISAPITKTAGTAASFSLLAHGSIIVNAAIGSTAGAMAVTLASNIAGAGGFVNITAPITTLGGDIVIGGGANPLIGNAVGVSGSGVTLAGALDAGGGNITVHGLGSSLASGYGINTLAPIVTSGAGNITLVGTGSAGAISVGVASSKAITAGTGNILVTGTSGAGATGAQGFGIQLLAGVISTGGAGTITLNGTAHGNGTGANTQGVLISGGATVSAGNGLIAVTGTNASSGTGGTNHGISITGIGSTLRSTGTGGVSLIGFGGGTGSGGNNYGVNWAVTNAIQSIGGGAIAITGSGGGTGGSGAGNHGVNAGAALAGSGGTITITGTGGSTTSNNNFGVNQTGAITNILAGAITLVGTGGGSGNTEIGYNTTASITAATGNIAITGKAGPLATFIGNHGINIGSGITSTSGAGMITLDGTATGLGTGVQSHGVIIQSGAIVSASDGLISITGHNSSIGSGIGNNGVYVKGTGSAIRSTGIGGITMLGFGGGAGTSASNFGVYWDSANGIQSTATGAIVITGFGGDAAGSGLTNYGVNAAGALTAIGGKLTIVGTGGGKGGSGSGNSGVNIAAPLTGSGSAMSITGTGGASKGGSNFGIGQTAAITNTGAGAITLAGTGGGGGSLEDGIASKANITAGTGNILLIGLASPSGAGSANNGVNLTSAKIATAGAGTITIAGTARGSGVGATASGVFLQSGAALAAVNGAISVTGTNLSTGSGNANTGVYLTGATTMIISTGTGGLSISGSGGGSAASGGSHGVSWDATGVIQSTGLGPIAISGIGGNLAGTGAGNSGINGTTALAGSGNIALTGTASTSTGGGSYGIRITTLAAGAGAITLTSTSASNQTAALTGASLNLRGDGGVFSLTDAGNAVTTLAGATGSVTYAQAGSLTIGTLDGTPGLVTTAQPWVTSGGTLTIAAGAVVSGASPVLAATSVFINSGGSAAVVATSGRWLVYAANPAGSTFGLLDSHQGAVWNTAANGSVLADGNRYVFANQPTAIISTINASKVYGVDATAAVASRYVIDGLQGVTGAFLDTAADAFSGAPSVTSEGAAPTATTAAMPYAITVLPGTFTALTGYAFELASPGMLTVTQAPLTVTADAQSRAYGAANAPLGYTSSGLVNGDVLTGGLATAATTTSNVGDYAISQGSLAASANYRLIFMQGIETVTAASLTVTADAQSRAYGAANAALGYVSIGLVNGDVLTGGLSTAANTTSNIGDYAINQGSLAASANYTLTYQAANQNVTAAPLSVVADAQSRAYGAANAPLGYVSAGLVNGDVLTGGLSTAATTTSNVGDYAIGQGSLAASANYTLAYTQAIQSVTAAPLAVVADAQSRDVGAANPTLSYVVTGLKNNDGLSGALATTATTMSIAGTYEISQGTLAASSNYVLNYTDALITVRGSAPIVPDTSLVLASGYADARRDLKAAGRHAVIDVCTGLILDDAVPGRTIARAADLSCLPPRPGSRAGSTIADAAEPATIVHAGYHGRISARVVPRAH